MKQYIDILERVPLFAGIDREELERLVQELSVSIRHFLPKQAVYVGAMAFKIGIVVSGAVYIIREDFYGNENIIAIVKNGESFAEVFALTGVTALPIRVTAAEKAEIMFLDCRRFMSRTEKESGAIRQMRINMLYLLAEKNLILSQKINLLSKRTTREKLLEYLWNEARQQKSVSFSIPFNRQQLADFLAVDRSAMSMQLCRLRDEGQITFHKNQFTLLGWENKDL